MVFHVIGARLNPAPHFLWGLWYFCLLLGKPLLASGHGLKDLFASLYRINARALFLAVGVGEMFLTCELSALKVTLWPGEREINRVRRASSLRNLGLKVIIKITI